VKDLEGKLTDEERTEIESRITAVREALNGDDRGIIDSTKQQLAETLQRVGTRAYQAAGETPTDGKKGGPEGGEGGAPAGEEAGGEEETIEGEYKEV
jgi:molecular chaperone DnaK